MERLPDNSLRWYMNGRQSILCEAADLVSGRSVHNDSIRK